MHTRRSSPPRYTGTQWAARSVLLAMLACMIVAAAAIAGAFSQPLLGP